MSIEKMIILLFVFCSCTNTATKNNVNDGSNLKDVVVSNNDTITLSNDVDVFKTYETFKKIWTESNTPKKISLLSSFKKQKDSMDFYRNALLLIIEDYLLNTDAKLNNSIEDFIMFDYYWKAETMSFMSFNLEKYSFWLTDEKIEIEKKIKLYKIQSIMRGNNYYNVANFDRTYNIGLPSPNKKQTSNLDCTQLDGKINTYSKSSGDNFELELFIIANRDYIRSNYLCISKYLAEEIANDKLSRMEYRKLYYISLELGRADANKFQEQLDYRKKIRKNSKQK